MNKLRPIVDSDYLIYRVGFAVKDTEPVEYALATVKSCVLGMWEKFDQEGTLYLTGKGNFRDSLATIQPYKGNRDPSKRPFYYAEIKEYLINVHKAVLVEGQEADDAVGIEQWKHKDKSTCIVGQDKDLNMIPGWHHDPIKGTTWYINITDANAFFFEQMLTGDRTDNIPGIKGVGPVKAAKLLASCNKDVIRMTDVVKAEYKKAYGNDDVRYYKEISNLLWIRREENQTCPF